MIEIYKGYELIGLSPVYSRFVWTRRFARAGEFRLETHFCSELFRELAIGNVIYKRDTDEAAIIEHRSVIQTANDELLLVVAGRHLSSILDRRVFSFEGEIGVGELLRHIINTNFLAGAGANRSMAGDGFRFIMGNLPNTIISVEYRNQNVYNAISTLCAEHGLGFKVRFRPTERTLEFMFVQTNETDAIFSKEFANVIEQNYIDDIERYRNVVYIDDQFVHNDTLFRGFERREIAIAAPRGSGEMTYFLQSARDALHENRKIQVLSSTINPHSEQFVYQKDWDIGAMVTSRSADLGFMERELVSEIVEIYGEEGLSLVVNLGSDMM